MKIRNIAVVSLSSGILGEPFVQFEVEIGLRRLTEYGLNVKFMPHARMGLEYVRDHPEKRAEDLLAAFRDPETDMILCAVGGDDTYRLLPYLFDHNELAEAATDKVFLGFSDTTVNHLMLHKVGLRSFYGQAFLPDICELGPEMHPYTRRYFEELIATGGIREIRPSDVWYGERECFTPEQVGRQLSPRPDHGFELLERSSAAASIRCMTFSTGTATRICPSSAGSIACFRKRRTGKAASCCWNPARRSRRLTGTGRRLNISGMPAYSARYPACWPESPWTRRTRRNTGSC